MKLIAAVLLLCATAAFGFPSEPKGWMVPQMDGSLDWVSEADWRATVQAIEAEGALDVEEDISADALGRSSPVVFYLYTQKNPTQPQIIDITDAKSLKKTNWNKANPTRVIAHGWQNNYLSDVNVMIRDALLSTGAYNVIVVDWSHYAESYNYAASKLRVKGVGKQCAKMLDFMNKSGGMFFGTLGVIGHSLGAHVAGNTGKYVTRGRIPFIVGLDPALPLYSYDDTSDRLCTTDAIYVESIQTCGGLLGFLQPIGQAAFYPNGGKSQPGCGIDPAGSCAHSRSFEYYAESIERESFPSIRCKSYEDAIEKECGQSYSTVRLGSPATTGTNAGVYYTPVNKSSPFGRG